MEVMNSRGQQVISLSDAAQLFHYSPETLRQRINRNPDRFAGESWTLTGDELTATNCSAQKIRKMRVITKRGLAVLSTMLKGLAAEQRTEGIIDEYFKREESFQPPATIAPITTLPAVMEQPSAATVELLVQNAVLVERDKHRQREIELLNELREQDKRLLELASQPAMLLSPPFPAAEPVQPEPPANDIPPGFIALTDASELYGLSRQMTERLAKAKGCRIRWGSKYSAQRGGMVTTKCVNLDDYERAFYGYIRKQAIQIGGGYRLEGFSQRFELNRNAPRYNAPAHA